METLKKLLSHDGYEVLNFLENHQISNVNEIGLWAWIANRWIYWNESGSYHRIYTSTTYFQCNQQGWREFVNHTEEIRNAIFLKIRDKIKQYLSEKETDTVLLAGKIFNVAYPRWVSVGNGDTKGYDENVPMLWENFKPYRHYFEQILGEFEIFDNEWITTAQVMWEHCRWVGDKYEDYFSQEASGYFLEKAILLNPKQPIHYINLRDKREIRPDYDKPPIQTDIFTQLQSHLGLIYLYYAQWQNFHKQNTNEAKKYYLKFIESEPNLLPDNIFKFYCECAYERMYSPSVQTALTQLAEICIQNDDIREAEKYLQEAINKQKNNFLAPYQLLADLKYKQGHINEAIHLLEQKIEIWNTANSLIKKVYFEVSYEPQNNQYYYLEGNYYTRIDITFLHQHLVQLADWCWKAKEYIKAQKNYKQLRLLINNPEYVWMVKRVANIDLNELKIEVLEKQMEIAFILKDYWQALGIFEQIEKIKHPNEKSIIIKEQIKKILKH
ncbi:hypothetical protein AD998_07355 [bacterium 336/3]|nr:hypothetical protein AD998_07355 [bacterium 336/3]